MSSSIQLFSIRDKVEPLQGTTVLFEKELQHLIERNMDAFFNISFLESEYSTGPQHGGRIDSLGIDDTGGPVIFEYKRQMNENVINQGLFYLDWLLDHKETFELLVLKKFGKDQADEIDWNSARLICIANDFTRYDEHAVRLIQRNIELIRYIKFSDELLLFELVNSNNSPLITSEKNGTSIDKTKVSPGSTRKQKTAEQNLEESSQELKSLFEMLQDYCLALGQDVSYKIGLDQFIFKRFKNFVCAEVHPRDNELVLYLKINPEMVNIEAGFTRDMRNINHWGTGNLEVRIRDEDQLEKAKLLIQDSYEAS